MDETSAQDNQALQKMTLATNDQPMAGSLSVENAPRTDTRSVSGERSEQRAFGERSEPNAIAGGSSSLESEDITDTNKYQEAHASITQVAGYLATLDTTAFQNYCATQKLDPSQILPTTLTDTTQVFNCLQTFLVNGVWLGYLFNRVDIWKLYLHECTNETHRKGLDLLLVYPKRESIMLFYRACYRFGFPAIDDASFDVLEKLYVQTYPDLQFLQTQTYDDDEYPPVVIEAIKYCGISSRDIAPTGAVVAKHALTTTETEAFEAEKTYSIMSIENYAEIYEFLKNAESTAGNTIAVSFSAKIDGVNTKSLYDENGGGLKVALSRGRVSSSFDYTDAVSRVLQNRNIDTSLLSGRVVAEGFVAKEGIKYINAKYPGRNYLTPKSAASAMLRSPGKFADNDYKFLHLMAFSYNDCLADESIRSLGAMGFETPIEIIVQPQNMVLTDLDSFTSWINFEVLDPIWYWQQENDISADGVVVALLAHIATERNDKYTDQVRAIKFYHWAASDYKSIVTGIEFMQKRTEMSIVLQIEPVQTRDGNTAMRVGIGSPDILIKDDVKVGSEIIFSRKSDAYNVYTRKEVSG